MSNVKTQFKAFLAEHNLTSINIKSLQNVADKLGITIIEFSHISNSEEVQTVISNLGLVEVCRVSNGFTYADKKFKLIFINEGLSEKEKLQILSHELGHIVLGHLEKRAIIGSDVKEEAEANEFSHYLLNPSIFIKLSAFNKKHKKGVIAGAVALSLGITSGAGFCIYETQKSYYGEYYVTESGHKYHKKSCYYVSTKTNIRRLTKEEFDSNKYSPCKVCLPDEQ